MATRASSSQAQRPAESAARLAFALAFGCLASTAACVDYKTDPGYCGTCKVDAGGGQKDAAQDAMSAVDGHIATGDASHDAGKDGGGGGGDAGDAGDANVGTDAGPCGKTCGGNAPACDVASSHCVQCTAAEHAACKGATLCANVA